MGLSTCAKGCIACSVCTVVVLAVMIPVGLLVIAPNMGQHALDVSTMNISNATMWDITFDRGNIYNDVTLTQSSLPLAATLKQTDMVLHIPAGSSPFTGAWNATNMGWFSMPEESIKHGDTTFTFTQTFHPFYGEAFEIMSNWAFALMFHFVPVTNMYIAGRPKLQAMGIVHMDLKMGKNLSCVSITPVPPQTEEFEELRELVLSDPSEETITMAARRLQDEGLGPVSLACETVNNLDSDLLDQILSDYERDRAVTTTTTTTTTTTSTTTISTTSTPAVTTTNATMV